jgi:(1->4)-alpha-D-glucan 1-alpha-D-glucosylmutase
MPLPESTYRLQFHAGFTFRDAAAIVPYLHDLGLTHAYASPYLKARPGSTHGYDVIDHCALNPEVGTEAEYEAWVGAMRSRGMGHVLDIVPNHVGVATNDNRWWNDVLEHGPTSRYAHYFDIAWRGSPRPQLHDKVMLPLLGGHYGDVLEKGELQLKFEHGAFAVHYYDRRFPISPRTYGSILGRNAAAIARSAERHDPAIHEYRAVLRMADDLQGPDDPGAALPGGAAEAEEVKQRLGALAADSAAVRQLIEQNLAEFNGRPGDPHSFDPLDDLLNDQSYRLAYWRAAPDEINYRRFFDINDLAALSMERPEVFEDTHALILRLVAEGKVDGLRVDHPDGLYDPKQYFERVQTAAGQETEWARSSSPSLLYSGERVGARGSAQSGIGNRQSAIETAPHPNRLPGVPGRGDKAVYVVAEKILAPDEPLPDDWAVHGTSGYDFLNMANGLFVDAAKEAAFTSLYQDFTGERSNFDDLVYAKKRLILDIALASELQMLAHRLDRLAQKDRHSRDFTLTGLREALREVIACFPVYRSYVSAEGVHESDRAYMETAVERATRRNPETDPAVFGYVRDVVLQKYPDTFGDAERAEQLEFAGKFQQVTSPTIAKGVEDTAFYVYNRLVSLNEVGGEPGRFGVAPEAVHAYFRDRQQRWPHAMSALSTHDTKRSEDVRARINVLSEMPSEWGAAVKRWRDLNAPHRQSAASGFAPTANDEYLLYQTLVGAYPLAPQSPEEQKSFVGRIQSYMEKAMREAKVHTSWTSPNAEYEGAVKQFVARILDEKTGKGFLEDFRPFQRTVSQTGLLNSLAQTVLKLTAPGVPDTYQGTELWDFSLVDPDNRRPVDYPLRRALLTALNARGPATAVLARELLESKEDGRIKLWVTSRALQARRDNPGLFSEGEYLPAERSGTHRDRVFAFARNHSGRTAIVAVPRLTKGLTAWGDTRLHFPGLPANEKPRYRNLFTGESHSLSPAKDGPSLSAAELFATLPFAVLLASD